MMIIEDSTARVTIWRRLLINLVILRSDWCAARDPGDLWSAGTSVTCSGHTGLLLQTILLQQLNKNLGFVEEKNKMTDNVAQADCQMETKDVIRK